MTASLHITDSRQVVFTQLIDRIPPRNETSNKTLIIVHRKELVEQAAKHCHAAYPDKSIDVDMGNNVASGYADITIASVQSLLSKDRYLKYNPDLFKLVLVDEAHHIVAKSYRTTMEHFRLNEKSDDSPALVGVSATLSRFDGLKLGAAIDHIVYHKDYVDMIDESWLSNAIFTTVKSHADLSKVRKDQFGDFSIASLARAVNTETTNDVTVRAWLSNAQDRKSTLVFCVDVEHTKQLTEKFREAGVDSRYITAKTPKDVRAAQLLAFKNQEYKILLNCGLFTEGTDIPNIDCVLLARPTKSRNLLIQMIGRGLRLYPGKENCHIIDMVATLETGVLSTPTLFGLDPSELLDKSTAKDLKDRADDSPNLGTPRAVGGALPPDLVNVTFTKYDTIYDLIGDINLDKHIRSISRFTWVRIGPESYVLSSASGWVTIDKNPDAEGEPNTQNQTQTQNQELYTVQVVIKYNDPDTNKPVYTRPRQIASAPNFETAVHAADTFAAKQFEYKQIAADQRWRQSGATEMQLRMLNRGRMRENEFRWRDINRGEASDMITRIRLGGKRFLANLERHRERAAEVKELRKKQKVMVGPVES